MTSPSALLAGSCCPRVAGTLTWWGIRSRRILPWRAACPTESKIVDDHTTGILDGPPQPKGGRRKKNFQGPPASKAPTRGAETVGQSRTEGAWPPVRGLTRADWLIGRRGGAAVHGQGEILGKPDLGARLARTHEPETLPPFPCATATLLHHCGPCLAIPLVAARPIPCPCPAHAASVFDLFDHFFASSTRTKNPVFARHAD